MTIFHQNILRRITLYKGLLYTIFILYSSISSSKDIIVTGRISTISGVSVPDASVKMKSGNAIYGAVTGTDGYYSIRISGIYTEIEDDLQPGTPHPNPFTFAVNIPFIINSSGDIRFTVYTYTGSKIRDLTFKNVTAGSYRIVWDGCNDSGAPTGQGFYVYAISFKGSTWSGKIIKAAGFSTFSSSTTLEPVMLPPVLPPPEQNYRIPVITDITCNGFYPLKQTDISLSRDTIIDFVLAKTDPLPYKTIQNKIAYKGETGYTSLFLKGINLGACTPGTFPGEIAYSIPGEMYEQWIEKIAETGFNSIRIYTLHPPVFYEKLANYNNRHPENPLYLFQGVWLDEIEDRTDPSEYNLYNRITPFKNNIEEIIDCIHGNKSIAFRPGRAYGNYITDISRWTAAYVIGREISPQEVEVTDLLNASSTSFSGSGFSITGGTPTEVFVTRMIDHTAAYENQKYSVRRPVSMSSWPTLDPLIHPTEVNTDEDKASFNIMKITGKDQNAGIFALYHAYSYYPNFISEEPAYQSYSDSYGKNSYLGYLTALKNHYSTIPLIIGEFGVPSSWGSAHQSFSKMDHGGYSEIQQGEINVRQIHNIHDAGCAGGFMFAWMDEWFKPTWIVAYLEGFGFKSGDVTIPTRQLWHNVTSPEQNFGLVSFQQKSTLPFISYQTNNASGPVRKIESTHDNTYFYLNVETSQPIVAGDTIIIAFDTYSQATGESRLPNGKNLTNRSEFILTTVAGKDTSVFQVTEAYNMYGLTPRFNLSNPAKQKYMSTVTNGAPWVTVEWLNDQYLLTSQFPGLMPAENATTFQTGSRSAVAWSASTLKIRVPWTLLHFYDPTRSHVINGATSYDGGYSFEISSVKSDGIAVSVYRKGVITSTVTRYTWNSWLIVPETTWKEKASLKIVANGLKSVPGIAD